MLWIDDAHESKKMVLTAAMIMLAIVGIAALQIDDWSRDLSTNRASTSSVAQNPLLRPLDLPTPPAKVHEQLLLLVDRLPDWSLLEATHQETSKQNASFVLALTRTSKIFHFVDDVHVSLLATPTGTRVELTSQSRIGKGDLGQNPRNIEQLMQALREQFNMGSISNL